MNRATLQIVRAALRNDATVSHDQAETAISILKGRVPHDGVLPLLLSQKQAAVLLGVSRYTVRRLVQRQILHPVKLNGSCRFRRKEIEAIADGESD